MAKSTRPEVVDLFAGAGLLSYAFRREGFRVTRALELDVIAASTYRRNLGDHVEIADVRCVQLEGRCDVLVAGTPCQGFSSLNRRPDEDPRNALSLEVVRWARALHPQVVVIENVPNFLSAPVWRKVRRGFVRLGFGVAHCVLDAFEFGAPQLRRRSFTIATRGDLPQIRRLRRIYDVRAVREAWAGLPETPDGRNNHFAPRPSDVALARMRVIPPGGDKRDVLQRAPHLSARSWEATSSEATDVWGRMHWNGPSNTLRTAFQNASKGRYVHPEQNRVISLREGARLQTIPDSFVFDGLHTQITRQIGNSVPPALGRAIARAVLRCLR